MRDLKGKRVLITGAARGIGRAIAERFAREGAALLITDIDQGALDEAGKALAGCRTYKADVTDTAAMPALRAHINDDGGPIDVLVNNAGVVFGGPFLEVPLERHFLCYRINVLGLVAMTHTFLPDLIGRPEGHLVNISSASSLIGLPFGGTYASSKWAVSGFSESLRLELEILGHGHVKVTNVCPSYVDTGLFHGVKPPRTTRMLRPDELGGIVVDAVKSNREEVLAPWLVKLTPTLKALLPRSLFKTAASITGATTSMTTFKGRGA